jgi:enamine deaminase RidA (YjgF/YER057c/UK114 family)
MKKLIPLLGVFLLLSTIMSASSPELKLAELGLVLPPVSKPVANYVPAVRTGNLIYLAGQISRDAQGKAIAGKLGRDVSVEQGAEAARRCALAMLALLKSELGELSRVKRVVRVGGFVNSSPGFNQQASVMNGCSDLLVAVFGEAGKHARTSVGVAELPADAAVETDLVAEITD